MSLLTDIFKEVKAIKKINQISVWDVQAQGLEFRCQCTCEMSDMDAQCSVTLVWWEGQTQEVCWGLWPPVQLQVQWETLPRGKKMERDTAGILFFPSGMCSDLLACVHGVHKPPTRERERGHREMIKTMSLSFKHSQAYLIEYAFPKTCGGWVQEFSW